VIIAKAALGAATVTVALGLSGPATAEGNRYDFDRFYTAEASPAQTYLEMVSGDAIVIDVRRLREYYAGHPYAEDAPAGYQHAYNVPYPHIVNNDQSPQAF